MNVVLVLDDEEKLRKRFVKQIGGMPSVSSVVDFDSADKLLATINSLKPIPSVFILDINMPGESNGVDVLKFVVENYPASTVYMFTSSEDANEHRRCIELGAKDVVVKPMGRIAMQAALNQLIEG